MYHAGVPSQPDSRATALPVPVFVLGTKGRSGTGLLTALLRLHPDCTAPPPPMAREDWLLHHAHHLGTYAGELARRLGGLSDATPVDGFDERVLAALGRGLQELLGAAAGTASHVIAKSPTLDGIEIGFHLLPTARFLVLVRNGPDSVESSLRSWPRRDVGNAENLETFARHWRQGARHLLELMERHPGRLMSVRYEDLVLDRERRLRLVFDHVGLDAARYDFAAAAACPVYGSSSFGRREGRVSYAPVPAAAGFRPLERAASWGTDEHRRFNRIAGDMMRAFGYPLVAA
ncbi:MAG: sulfotransferase [Gammaproteobacteria bacterium]